MTNEKKEFSRIKGHVIVAPHPDDEIIGNFDVIKNKKPCIIYMGDIDNKRRQEALNLKKYTDIGVQLFLNSVPNDFINKETILYFPDPYFETHYFHRAVGLMGEQIARQGFNVIFYNITMTAPYMKEVKDWEEKRDLLNKVYPSQKSLWEYEHKYFMFEGKCKWIF